MMCLCPCKRCTTAVQRRKAVFILDASAAHYEGKQLSPETWTKLIGDRRLAHSAWRAVAENSGRLSIADGFLMAASLLMDGAE